MDIEEVKAIHYGECPECREFIRPGDTVWLNGRILICGHCAHERGVKLAWDQEELTLIRSKCCTNLPPNPHGPQRQDQRDDLHF